MRCDTGSASNAISAQICKTNWKAKPLVNVQFVIDLISSTTTSKGLKVKAKLDETLYEKGIKITDEEFEKLSIVRDDFHGGMELYNTTN